MQSGYINSRKRPVIGQWFLKGRRLFGWAALVSGPAEAVSVGVFVKSGRKIRRSEITCDRYWAGELPAQVRHRFVAFEYILETSILRDVAAVHLQLTIGDEEYASPVVVIPTDGFSATQLHIDVIGRDLIEGWAWSPMKGSDEPVYLDLDEKRFTVWATEFRQDLFDAGFAAGACSFSFDLRRSGGPLTAKVVRATFKGVTKEIRVGQRDSAFDKLGDTSLLKLAGSNIKPQPRYLITV